MGAEENGQMKDIRQPSPEQATQSEQALAQPVQTTCSIPDTDVQVLSYALGH
jgi:hypothetical protein